jgi:hypothetical protein
VYFFYVLRFDGSGSYVGGGGLINMIELREFFFRVHTHSVFLSLHKDGSGLFRV